MPNRCHLRSRGVLHVSRPGHPRRSWVYGASRCGSRPFYEKNRSARLGIYSDDSRLRLYRPCRYGCENLEQQERSFHDHLYGPVYVLRRPIACLRSFLRCSFRGIFRDGGFPDLSLGLVYGNSDRLFFKEYPLQRHSIPFCNGFASLSYASGWCCLQECMAENE